MFLNHGFILTFVYSFVCGCWDSWTPHPLTVDEDTGDACTSLEVPFSSTLLYYYLVDGKFVSYAVLQKLNLTRREVDNTLPCLPDESGNLCNKVLLF